MIDREKAIIMAYTGVCMLAGDKQYLFYRYVQGKLGRCIMTHELAYPEVQDAIKEASHDDFIELCKQSDEPRMMTLDEACSDIDFCWLEIKDYQAVWVSDCVMMPNGRQVLIERLGCDPVAFKPEDYGKTWRCWTARPTDEQREAARWDD